MLWCFVSEAFAIEQREEQEMEKYRGFDFERHLNYAWTLRVGSSVTASVNNCPTVVYFR
jgi:hypothetical protein